MPQRSLPRALLPCFTLLLLGCHSCIFPTLGVAAASSRGGRGGGLTLPELLLHEHNPHNETVTKVHMVISSHLDFGAKTAGCGITHPDEPRFCARVIPNLPKHPGGMGEPYAYQLINRYFDEYFPAAVANAAAGRAAGVKYTYMTQPWIISLYLDCENAGMTLWPGLGGGAKVGVPSLHCPNATSIAAFKAALRNGDIFFHAFAHNAEASTYADASMFEAGIEIGERLASELGVSRPIAVSQRDVPGWTRATLPLLNKHGVVGLSFGAGTPPGKVDVPPLCVWRDIESGSEVVLTYETAYGSTATVFVLPTGEALCAVFAGDNTGPPPLSDVASFYATLRKQYPAAEVSASTFDRFFAAASKPEVKAKLPVVTAEIEDAWIYGVPAGMYGCAPI
jgi:hypothetical protein